MATIAQDLAAARNLTVDKSAIADDGIPPLEVVAAQKERDQPAAAIYGRHSSSKQKSIHAQIRLGTARCDERGWAIRYVLRDPGVSANDPDREAFQRLLQLIGESAIDVVVVWKIDRIVRNLAQAAVLNDFATEHGVAIHSLTEPIDTTTPLGRFVFGIIANAAQLELDMLKERVSMGIEQRALEGRWPRPSVPFGYRRTKGNFLRIHGGESLVVRACFACYIETKSYSRAACKMNESNYTWRGKAWTDERVRQVIENPIYEGRICIGGVESIREKNRIMDQSQARKAKKIRSQSPNSGKPLPFDQKEAAIESVFSQYLDSLSELD